MQFSTSLPSGTETPDRRPAALVLLAGVLVAVFVLAPRQLAGGGIEGRQDLVESARSSFVVFWSDRSHQLSGSFEPAASYWANYHGVKAVAAALLVVAFAGVGVSLWRRFPRCCR